MPNQVSKKVATAAFNYSLLLLTLLCPFTGLHAGEAGVTFKTSYFEDVGNKISLADILREDAQASGPRRFREPSANGLSFGWVNNPFWVKVDIEHYSLRETLFLEIAWPLLDKLDIYIVGENNQLLKTYNLGDHQNYSERPIPDAHFVVPIDFASQPIRNIYFNIDTTSSMQLPLEFWTQKDYLAHRAHYLTAQGIFYGLLLVMIFYNLFIYFSIRRVAYLHYVCFVSAFGILQAGLKGTGFQFIWPNTPALNDFAISTSGGFSLLFLTLFARSFLQLSEAPILKKINNYMLLVAILFIFASILLPYRTVITPLTISVLIASFAVISKAIYRYMQGFHEARFYLMAWLAMVTGCCIYLFKQLGLLPINSFTQSSMQIGSAMEVLLLSLALADRLNTLRQGLVNANQRLEKDVQERTQELVTALDNLGDANKKLAKLSTTDGLTGLRNRYYFDCTLAKELHKANCNHETLSLLLLDIDHFKSINDKWGHVMGDRALRLVAQVLLSICTRQTDTVFRYGGEEFAILLAETDLNGAARVAEKICRHVESTEFYEKGSRIHMTISVGLSTSTTVSSTTAALVRTADFALYNAKADGRNCVHIFEAATKDSTAEPEESSKRFSPKTNLNHE